MATHKTLCRWCGGEMVLEEEINNSDNCQWQCIHCDVYTRYFTDVPEALEWASQPIPFLLDEKLFGPNAIIIKGINETITSTLAVREEEQK